jgi:Flp pilus assembly protein TadG
VFASFRRLITDVQGAVAPLAALFIMVLAPMTGLAVDYIIATSAKRAMQDAIDSALLAVARANPRTQAEIDRIGQRFFDANLAQRYGVKSFTVQIRRVGDGAFTGDARADVPLFFAGLFGESGMTAAVDGDVNVNLTELEVVLALDTTGSMMGSKLSALKSAAGDFITTMSKGTNVKTGIVPFARYVNIGMANRNEPGFAIPADTRSCSMQTVRESYNCRNCRRIPRSGTCYNDGRPYTCSWTETRCDCDTREVTKNVCNTQTWNGCVGSRSEPLNTRDDDPSVKIPGLLNVNCGAPLTRLTTSASTLRNAVNALNATGETYIPSGLSMAWAVLSHRVPFTQGSDPAAPSNKNKLRAIVLMTDGANTASKRAGRPDHDGGDVSAANSVTRQLCENIKDDDVLVFTVAFEVSDNTIKGLLRSCSTAPGYAYDASNPGELADAFEEIAVALSRLRLTQ